MAQKVIRFVTQRLKRDRDSVSEKRVSERKTKREIITVSRTKLRHFITSRTAFVGFS